MQKFTLTIILTMLFLQMALELQLKWILVALIIASFAFMLVHAKTVVGKSSKAVKRALFKSAVDCGASFCIGLIIIPFILELLESRGWTISIPLIGVISLFTMFFGYQIRPIVLMFLRTKGIDTESIEEDGEKRKDK